MLDIGIRIVVNAIALVAAIRLVPNVTFTGDWWQLALLAIVFGLVNGYLRPIVKLLSLPLSLLTFGLIGFVINTAMVLVAAFAGDYLDLGFQLAGWPAGDFSLDVIIAAFLTSLVLSIVSVIMAFVRLAAPRI
jgi:putative membrane protein